MKGLRAADAHMENGDPTCPGCGEPVSRTASFCIHCHADLDGRGDVDAAVVDMSEGVGRGTAGTPTDAATTDDDRGWFHPESTLDDVSTVAVGAVGGLAVAAPTTVLGLVYARSALWFFAFPVLWVAVWLYVAYTRSVFGAARKAAYLLAPVLAACPLFWFGPALQGGDLGGRVVGTLLTALVAVPLAVGVAGLGYWLGGMAPDR